MQQNVALHVVRKLELSYTFRNVARQVAACNTSSATCNAFFLNELIRVRPLLAGDFIISNGRVASCEQKLRACDIPSATCSVFQSSSFCRRLQEKL